MTEQSQTTTRVEWGIAFDDGDIDVMPNRSACVEAVRIMNDKIATGFYDEEDYAGRRIVTRVVKVTTAATPWGVPSGDAGGPGGTVPKPEDEAELLSAEDIVRRLADERIELEADTWMVACASCDADIPQGVELSDPEHHQPGCLWVAAVEWVERNRLDPATAPRGDG